MSSGRLQAYLVPAVFCLGYFVLSLVLACAIQTSMYAVMVADALCFIACLAYRRHMKWDSGRYPLKASDWVVIGMSIFVIWFVSQLFAGIIIEAGDAAYDAYSNSVSSANPIVIVTVAVVFAPCAEEMLLRGVVYANARARTSAISAALISACVFALFHGTMAHIPLSFMFSFLACYLYERYRRVWPCIAAHAVFNALTIALSSMEVPDFLVDPYFVVLLFLAVMAILAYALQTASKRTDARM